MRTMRAQKRDAWLAAGYGLLAIASVLFTRFDGGVAFLWAANALLIAELIGRRRSEWPTLVACCGLVSMAATGCFGLGWPSAIPFAIFNMLEAVVGAVLLARWRPDRRPFGSLNWIAPFVASVGILAPLTIALCGALWLGALGAPLITTFFNLITGHALGNLTFVPVFMLILSGRLLFSVRSMSRRRVRNTAWLLGLVAASVVTTFAQSALPLLFLPAGPMILAVFRGREVGAIGSVMILCVVGGLLTVYGHGPIELIEASAGIRMHFFQLYLAAVVMTILPITADLSARVRLYRELRASEARYRLLADHSTDIILHVRPDGRIRYASPAISQLGGYSPSQVRGRSIRELIPQESLQQVIEGYQATIAANGATHSYRHLGRLADGRKHWFESHSRVLFDADGMVESVLSVVRDISKQVRAEDRLQAAAMTDPLTGLANRRAFLARADTFYRAGEVVMVALLDIDHFKKVNDRFGHDAGDDVLRSFAVIAQRAVRRDDVVARLGGEEFALLLPGLTHSGALAICDRLRREVSESLHITAAGPVRITISGGLVAMGRSGIDEALKLADKALYEAKNGGRDQLAMAA